MSVIVVGDTGTHVAPVAEPDTAIQMGSGDVPVLATPRVVAWMEAAAVAALRQLPDEMTSVGIRVSVDHSSPTLVGASVHTVAEVIAVDGDRIEFDVRAFEGNRIIATGTHIRAVVDRQRFLVRAGRAPA